MHPRMLFFLVSLVSLMLSSCAVRDELRFDSPQVDHDYRSMKMFGFSASKANSLLASWRSVDHLKISQEFTIESSDFGYLSDVLTLLYRAEKEDGCAISVNLRWVIEFKPTKGKGTYVSDGKVITGPDGFCRSARGFENVDFVEFIRNILDSQ